MWTVYHQTNRKSTTRYRKTKVTPVTSFRGQHYTEISTTADGEFLPLVASYIPTNAFIELDKENSHNLVNPREFVYKVHRSAKECWNDARDEAVWMELVVSRILRQGVGKGSLVTLLNMQKCRNGIAYTMHRLLCRIITIPFLFLLSC